MAKKKDNPKEKLQELGKRVSKDINKNKNPNIDVPIRALSNVSYDKRNKILMMGNKIAKRFFF